MKQALQCILVILVAFSGFVGIAGAEIQETESDSVVTSFTLDESGDAIWTIEYRTRIDSPEKRDAFLAMQANISDNPTGYLDRFEGRIDRTVADAEHVANRRMSAEEVQINVRLVEFPQEYGVVEYSFVWTNFAIVDGENIIVSDALSGFFIEEDGRLIVRWSDELAVKSILPSPTVRTGTSATWEGPVDFDRPSPILELQPSELATPTEPEPTTPTPTPTPPVDGPSEPPVDDSKYDSLLLLGSGGIILVLLVVIAYLLRSLWYSPKEPAETAVPEGDEDPADEEDESESAEITGELSDEDSAQTEPVDESLLSNEERVLRVLEQNGGRVKQQSIVGELGWTDAKASLVVSEMRENGTVDVFRLGRENVVSLIDYKQE
jgi:hypothetical protein